MLTDGVDESRDRESDRIGPFALVSRDVILVAYRESRRSEDRISDATRTGSLDVREGTESLDVTNIESRV